MSTIEIGQRSEISWLADKICPDPSAAQKCEIHGGGECDENFVQLGPPALGEIHILVGRRGSWGWEPGADLDHSQIVRLIEKLTEARAQLEQEAEGTVAVAALAAESAGGPTVADAPAVSPTLNTPGCDYCADLVLYGGDESCPKCGTSGPLNI
ncbi:hypothetical protein [Candidatus Poriferisodalis sp.]|uniref:hypothetical protein n=1 Tax=Candidatus Poriferisodalis sp. TaxID=3101277 RepID=UPI003D0EB83C